MEGLKNGRKKKIKFYVPDYMNHQLKTSIAYTFLIRDLLNQLTPAIRSNAIQVKCINSKEINFCSLKQNHIKPIRLTRQDFYDALKTDKCE